MILFKNYLKLVHPKCLILSSFTIYLYLSVFLYPSIQILCELFSFHTKEKMEIPFY